MIKTAVIRVDASVEMGTGHVMRCLTLAEELKDNSYDVTFIINNQEGHSADFIESKGFHVITLQKVSQGNNFQGDLQHSDWLESSQEEDAKEVLHALNHLNVIDLLIVDHYAIDYRWELLFKERVKKIFVIDDLADRQHACDVLLDQNFYLDMEKRYEGLVDKNCELLLGPKYVLLRKEFKEARKKLSVRSGGIQRILVFFGGSDPTNETTKVVKAIEKIDKQDIFVDVVVGASNPNKDKVEELVNKHSNMTYYCQVSNMAELMVKADLAIGAGGSTTWERCYLGLPAITIGVAYNQIEILRDVEKSGAIINLGYSSLVSIENLADKIKLLLSNSNTLKQMSIQSSKLINH